MSTIQTLVKNKTSTAMFVKHTFRMALYCLLNVFVVFWREQELRGTRKTSSLHLHRKASRKFLWMKVGFNVYKMVHSRWLVSSWTVSRLISQSKNIFDQLFQSSFKVSFLVTWVSSDFARAFGAKIPRWSNDKHEQNESIVKCGHGFF